MKNKNLILVYDDLCPLCALYTSWFVKTGLLPAEGRKSFSDLSPVLLNKIDFDKSRNEIPLIDTNQNRVLYGIDSLLEILAQDFPFLKSIGNLSPVKWFLKKFYKFISYNRKVIVAKKCGPGAIDCSPDFNIFYRTLFMLVFLLFNTAMLFPVHNFVLRSIPQYQHSAMALQVAHACLVILNIFLAASLDLRKAIDYLGQVNMLALISILLLIPLVFLNKGGIASYEMNIIYLTVATCIVVKEYCRRMAYVGIAKENKLIRGINLFSLVAFLGYLFVPF